MVTKESKAGWKTTEFYVALGSILLIVLDVIPLADKAEGKYAAIISVGYIVARGLAKLGTRHEEIPVAKDVERDSADDGDLHDGGLT